MGLTVQRHLSSELGVPTVAVPVPDPASAFLFDSNALLAPEQIRIPLSTINMIRLPFLTHYFFLARLQPTPPGPQQTMARGAHVSAGGGQGSGLALIWWGLLVCFLLTMVLPGTALFCVGRLAFQPTPHSPTPADPPTFFSHSHCSPGETFALISGWLGWCSSSSRRPSSPSPSSGTTSSAPRPSHPSPPNDILLTPS